MSAIPTVDERLFDDADALARALADDLADLVHTAVAADGAAALVASGGTTPGPVYDRLAQADLPWAQVSVVPSDERWVAETDPASNARLIAERLITGRAAAARYVSLITEDADPFAAEAQVSARIAALPRPFAAVLLGMGADGHTASLFPGVGGVAPAMDADDPALARGIGPVAGAAGAAYRITLTLRALLAARRVILLFRGEEKLAVYRAALQISDPAGAPVSAVLHQTLAPVSLYWAP